MNHNKMKIEIWSDVMCPFCYIGKRRFEKALSTFEHKENVEVVWKSFQLNPDLKTDTSVNLTEQLAQSKGWTMEYTKQMQDHVVNMAKSENLEYDFDKAVVANSFNAHRLLQYAKTQNKGNALKEALLKAYFIDGKNTDDNDVLLNLALESGLDSAEAKNVLEQKERFAQEVNHDVVEAQQLGVNGVPFFVLDRKYGISGAQEKGVFMANLDQAYKEWSEENLPKTLNVTEGPVCTPDGDCN